MINYQYLTDQELVAEIVDKNADAFAALYDRYGKRVFGLAARVLNDSVKSEEVTQDVFMRVWRRGHTYMPDKGKFTTWLFRIAHNRTIDELRRIKRDKSRFSDDITERYDLESDDISPPEAAVANSEYEQVRAALNVLPEPQRQVVYLSYFEGLTQTQIAETTVQPLGTVKTRMRLALKRLRITLDNEIYGDH